MIPVPFNETTCEDKANLKTFTCPYSQIASVYGCSIRAFANLCPHIPQNVPSAGFVAWQFGQEAEEAIVVASLLDLLTGGRIGGVFFVAIVPQLGQKEKKVSSIRSDVSHLLHVGLRSALHTKQYRRCLPTIQVSLSLQSGQ